MNYTQMIHELLDGTIEPHKEESLFMALSGSEDLRSELRQFIQFDIAVKNDNEAFRPEPESQDKIFGALGITGAAAVVGTVAANAPTFWLAKYLNQILIGLGSALVGSLMMFLWMSNDNIIESNDFTENKGVYSDRFNEINSNIPKMTSLKIDTVVKEKNIIRYVDRIIQLPASEIVNINETTEPENSNVFLVQSSDIQLNNINLNAKNHINFSKSMNNFGNYSNESLILNDFNLFDLSENLSLEFRANQDWSINKPTVERSSYPFFNNTTASLIYKISNDFSIGADLRQEYYYQEYNGIGADNNPYNYYQHTNYISAGILARYNLLNTSHANLFIQPAISFNQIGIAARSMIGSELKIADKVSVILGIEGSLLRYSHQGNPFYSPKIGFHYGIRLNP